MSQSIVELAKDLTLALIHMRTMSPEDMQYTLQETYATLTALKAQDEMRTSTAVPAAETLPVNWRTSITKHTVTCLTCGQTLKQLTRRHLRLHGLDNRSYRTTYGIPRTQPLAAKSVIARRRQVVQATRPWEKAPTFLKRQAQDGHAATAPEADTLRKEAEAPSAAAPPAPPKRQRRTAPKKKAARKKGAVR